MKKWMLYAIWGCLYVVCTALGYVVTGPDKMQETALFIISLIFFLPGAVLLVNARRQQDKKTLRTLRWISGLSLGLTLLLLVANIASALGSEALGNALYEILILVSVPMVCSRNWALSLLLWACIFCATLAWKKK